MDFESRDHAGDSRFLPLGFARGRNDKVYLDDNLGAGGAEGFQDYYGADGEGDYCGQCGDQHQGWV